MDNKNNFLLISDDDDEETKAMIEQLNQFMEFSQKQNSNGNTEGQGRAFGAGGDACDSCPHCYGSATWCPIMD